MARLSLLAVALASLLAVPAHAGEGEGTGTGFSYSGSIALDAFATTSSFSAVGMLQADLSYGLQAGGVDFGAGAWLSGITNGVTGSVNAQPYAYVNWGNYSLTAGYTQDAWDKLVPWNLLHRQLNGAMQFVYGPQVRLDTTVGGTDLSFSLDMDGDAIFAFSREAGQNTYYGAYFRETAGSYMAYTYGLVRQMSDRLMLGARVYHPGGTRNVKAEAVYAVTDKLDIYGVFDHETISWVLQSSGGGIYVDYEFVPNASLLAGYYLYRPVGGPDIQTLELGVGYSF